MKNLLVICVITVFTSSCYGVGKNLFYSDTTFNGIDFSEITFNIDKKTNDTISILGFL